MRQVRPAEIGLPASVNRYLLPHERSCITVRMHPAVLGGHLILASGGLMAARKLTSRSGRPDIVWGACLFLLLDFIRRVAAWPVTYFVVTNERMLFIRGLFFRTVTAMPLDKAMSLKLRRTILGRLLGYGSLIVGLPGPAPGRPQGQIPALPRTALPGDIRPALAGPERPGPSRRKTASPT